MQKCLWEYLTLSMALWLRNMKTNNLPLDLVMFMREYGILEEITLPEKQGSDTLPKYEVWIPKHEGEEIPFWNQKQKSKKS